MRIADKLASGANGVSFECFPPKTDAGRNNLYSAIGELKKYNPLFVSVTYGPAAVYPEGHFESLSLEDDFFVMNRAESASRIIENAGLI
ncbi:methylenetetrahydrofolate reductase [bacterium]|nr:hypothetical protein [bacterium]MBU3955148.1 methylenetetrahydrofolate reductase [bacterium]MBU4134427.1 methylenetetrahydrofolate reductase [bacterium]